MQFYLKNLGNVVNSNSNDFENPPEYITDEFSSWNVWLSHPVLLGKLAFKNKRYIHKIKLETHDQRILQSTQRQLLSDNYQCALHRGWTSYELLMYVQIRVCVYWVRRVMFLYGCREGRELQSLIKTTSSGQIQSYENGATGPLPIMFSES